MIQSETGTSDVHFEKGGVGGRGDGIGGEDVRVEESKIKGLASAETADGVSRQLAASDCSIGPCGSSIEGNFDMYMTILQEVIYIYDRNDRSPQELKGGFQILRRQRRGREGFSKCLRKYLTSIK